ncbi:hypothetical protein D3C80_1768880 [compost metagenome]
MAGANVLAHRRRHDADRPGTGNQHVFANQIKRQRGVNRIAERVEDRRQLIGNIVRDFEGVKRRDHQIFSK